MFGLAWCLVMVQFSLIIKKIEHPKHSLPPPPKSDNMSFIPYPKPYLLKVDFIFVQPLIRKTWSSTFGKQNAVES